MTLKNEFLLLSPCRFHHRVPAETLRGVPLGDMEELKTWYMSLPCHDRTDGSKFDYSPHCDK